MPVSDAVKKFCDNMGPSIAAHVAAQVKVATDPLNAQITDLQGQLAAARSTGPDPLQAQLDAANTEIQTITAEAVQDEQDNLAALGQALAAATGQPQAGS